MLMSGMTEFASMVLKVLWACWWELMSCHSQCPVYSLTFVVM